MRARSTGDSETVARTSSDAELTRNVGVSGCHDDAVLPIDDTRPLGPPIAVAVITGIPAAAAAAAGPVRDDADAVTRSAVDAQRLAET